MGELRWDPTRQEWVIIAPHRMKRPVLPKNFCPFCPGAPEVKDDKWDVLVLDNKYASLSNVSAFKVEELDSLTKKAINYGQCKVVIYSPEHDVELHEFDINHIVKIIKTWQNCYQQLSKDPFIKYVFIFENRGKLIGVTLEHPHCQIYAFPYIPPLIEKEIAASRRFFESFKSCIFCKIVNWFKDQHPELIVYENQNFLIFVPYWAHLPLETHIYPKRHFQNILQMNNREIVDFAKALKVIRMKYDKIFGFKLPYMMVFHQSPVNSGDYPFYHFHIEFYPLHRAKDKIKYLAGVEIGAGTFINPSSPEEYAENLRNINVEV